MSFWQKKFDDNVVRDMRNMNDLAEKGWDALVVWQCETEQAGALREKLVDFLAPSK